MLARIFTNSGRRYLGSPLIAAFLLTDLISPLRAASPTVDVRAAIAYDDNLNNAEAGSQQHHDTSMELDAILGYRQQLTATSGFIVKAGVESNLHANTTDLNALTLMASLTFLVQPIRGFGAPWFAVSGDYRWRRHKNSDIRDGTRASVELTTGGQFTDRVSMQVSYEFMDRDADEGRAFELGQRTLSAVLDYQISNRATTYFKYEYVNGGLVTTALPSMKFRGVTRAFAMDPAFGRGFVAWRLDGRAQSFRLGTNYLLAEKTGLDGSISYSHARADNDNNWNNWRVGVSLMHRFD